MKISEDNLKALSAFSEGASEFCGFIDSLRAGRPDRFYTALEAILPQLQRLILPVREEMAEKKLKARDALAMTHEQWQDIAKVIGEAVRHETHDVAVWHRSIRPNEAVAELSEFEAGSAEMLWDDLADIYRDLRNGLALWKIGDENGRAEAAWAWRWNYAHHWGRHLFRAMLTIHEIRYQLFVE